jgi:hypothetical protein
VTDDFDRHRTHSPTRSSSIIVATDAVLLKRVERELAGVASAASP